MLTINGTSTVCSFHDVNICMNRSHLPSVFMCDAHRHTISSFSMLAHPTGVTISHASFDFLLRTSILLWSECLTVSLCHLRPPDQRDAL